MASHELSQAELLYIRRRGAAGQSITGIARCLGRNRDVIARIMKEMGLIKNANPFDWKPSAEELREKLRSIPRDTRDLTGKLCGDPLPGRSALDRGEAMHG